MAIYCDKKKYTFDVIKYWIDILHIQVSKKKKQNLLHFQVVTMAILSVQCLLVKQLAFTSHLRIFYTKIRLFLFRRFGGGTINLKKEGPVD